MEAPVPTPSFARRPVIAIVGAGAIGAYYGGRLAQHGQDVHFLLRSDYDQVREHGWHIASHAGDFSLSPQQLQVYSDPAVMPPADVVIVTLKTTANHRLPELVAPLLHPTSLILTLQNGLGNEQILADAFGGARVYGGLAFICCNRLPGGQIHHSAHGLIRLGQYVPHQPDYSRWLAGLFNQSQVPCQAIENLELGRWEKLVWNVPFNGLGAALDLTTDRLLASPAGEKLVRQLMQEVIDAAGALNLPLPVAMIDQQIEKTRQMAAYRTSMQVDRQLGRPMEIEAILAAPARAAAAAKAATPGLDYLVELVRTIDGQ